MKESKTFPYNALLTVEEMRVYLRVSRLQAYELVRSNTVPHLKLGKQFRIPYWSLQQWAANQSGVADPEGTDPNESNVRQPDLAKVQCKEGECILNHLLKTISSS